MGGGRLTWAFESFNFFFSGGLLSVAGAASEGVAFSCSYSSLASWSLAALASCYC